MTDTELLKNRIKRIGSSKEPSSPEIVAYVMSRDQRVGYNHALIAAQKHAVALGLPLIVVFALYPSSTRRSHEQVRFMLSGLKEVAQSLRRHGVPFVCRMGSKRSVLLEVSRHTRPAAVYTDFSPLRHAQQEVKDIEKVAEFPLYVVDTHNIVPVWLTSNKQEYAARTIRPKIHRLLSGYLHQLEEVQSQSWPDVALPKSVNLDTVADKLSYKKSGVTYPYQSGEAAAQRVLEDFVAERLRGYSQNRNDPTVDGLSGLSPYLHFGQLSSLDVVLRVQEAAAIDATLQADANTLIEETVVRKELSDNWCYYNRDYDRLRGAPDWAQKTLGKHAEDPREYIYSLTQLREAHTHDPAWNAAQCELVKTGKMHGYMRMYWAKKVLEWSESPERAIDMLIHLNDFYSLDGGDPNGYAGIMWSVAGVHDRPWGERAVYGTVRSMVYTGLKRKFDVEQYIDKHTE